MTEDMLTLDWECIPCGPYIENIGAKRITLLKIKEGTSEEDMRFLHESIQLLPSKYIPQLFLFTNLNEIQYTYCKNVRKMIEAQIFGNRMKPGNRLP